MLIGVIGGISTLFGAIGVTAYLTERGKHKASKKNAESDRIESLLHESYKQELKSIIEDTVRPVSASLDKIDVMLGANTTGTITLLRDRMKCSLEFCKRQGWRSNTDLANWHELYESYKALGGNHFKEYVDLWKREMESLPTQEEYEAARKASRRPKKKSD